MTLSEKIGIAIVSCGGCRENKLCEKSRIETLNANGLDVKFADELEGLSKYGEYSAVYWKLLELHKRSRMEPQKYCNNMCGENTTEDNTHIKCGCPYGFIKDEEE